MFSKNTTMDFNGQFIYISKSLELCNLDEFFSTMELHETKITRRSKDWIHVREDVAFVTSKKEKGKKKKDCILLESSSKSSSSMDSDEEAYMEREISKHNCFKGSIGLRGAWLSLWYFIHNFLKLNIFPTIKNREIVG